MCRPDFVKPVAVPLSAMTEEIVSGVALFWMTTRSAPAAPSRVPPDIELPSVAAGVTRMPPVVITLVPLSVTVLTPEPLLNCRLLVVEPDAGVSFVVTVVLLPLAHVSAV